MKGTFRSIVNLLGWCAASFALLLFGCVVAGVRLYQEYSERAARLDLTKVDALAERSAVYDVNGELYGYFGGENRQIIESESCGPLDQLVNGIRAAHRHTKCPYVDDPPQIYSGTGIRWKGAEVCLQFYDKSVQMKKGRGDVMRGELQLKSRKMRSLISKKQHTSRLDFKTLYRVFGQTLWKLQPKDVPQLSKIADILAYGEHR